MSARRPLLHLRALEALVLAALNAYRQGQLGPLPARYPRLAHQVVQRWLPPVLGTLGDAVSASQREATATLLLLRWGLSALRPDHQPGLESISDHAWLHATSWRPMLAVACHYGLMEVPAFPARYRRRADESVIDNLCGLWAIGPSTLYRYLDKGRRQLAEVFLVAMRQGLPTLDLRRTTQALLRSLPEPAQGWVPWHQAQARQSLLQGDVMTGLWHQWQAGDVTGLLDTLQRHALEAASTLETDTLLAWIAADVPLSPTDQFEMTLRRATLWRHRQSRAQELEALTRAIRQAQDLGRPLQQGVALIAMARFSEADDIDRALALYDEAANLLTLGLDSLSGEIQTRVRTEHASALIRQAWLLLRRNNPRALAVLNRVEQLHQEAPLAGEVLGLYEQTRADYWRCTNEPLRAAEHMQRALIVFERLGDQRSILNTYRNLSLVYGELREHDKALKYGQRVLDAARDAAIETEVLAGTLGNMGVAYFYQGDLDAAIEHYGQALSIHEAHGMKSHLMTSHYNLAEALYRRFQTTGDPDDERRGDVHAATAARLSIALNASQTTAAAQSLKQDILGMGHSPERLLPQEFADHFDEMSEVQRLRIRLAGPLAPSEQVRVRLQIARAYLAVATKERETALALAQRHGIEERFDDEIEALRGTFERQLTREQSQLTQWREVAREFLKPAQCEAALTHLRTVGALNKSTYAEVCAVSPATASKHLTTLAALGLLLQMGKGPSTRYVLPSD